MTGFNDVRSTGSLYSDTNQSFYMKNILSTALTLSLPRNKIQNLNNSSWTKQGTNWLSETNVVDTGVKTNVIDDAIFKNVGTTRYIAIRFRVSENYGYNWEIYVNDVIVGTLKGTTPLGEGVTSIISIATIIDLGKNENDCLIKILNKDDVNNVKIIDFVACYTEDDLVNARPVLLLSTPRFNYQLDANATNNKRRAINDAKNQWQDYVV